MLSGAVCGGMTNTSGLGVAVDATKSEYPSIGYAATYPFAVVMMVVYTLFIQGLAF
jgi:putative transport protein